MGTECWNTRAHGRHFSFSSAYSVFYEHILSPLWEKMTMHTVLDHHIYIHVLAICFQTWHTWQHHVKWTNPQPHIFSVMFFSHPRSQVSESRDHELKRGKPLVKIRIFFSKLMFLGILSGDMKLLNTVSGNLLMPSLAVTNKILMFYTKKQNLRHSFIWEHPTGLCQIKYWKFCKTSVKSKSVLSKQHRVSAGHSTSEQCCDI